jgi:hypothetical protein
MGLLLVISLVALVAALVTRVIATRWKRGRTGAGTRASTTPTFRVVALGVAGSGKTVFLASMFHRLHVQSPGGSYYLETAAPQRVALSQVFRQVVDTSQPWPRGTQVGETREFAFDCVAFHEGAKHKVLSINYLDYAGELLESEQEAGSHALADLEQHIQEAHALLGMIDGYRVLQYLRGEPEGDAYVRSAIQPMIGFMAGAVCPIHFVLTKWDLVRDFGEPADADDDTRLGLVREALMDAMQIDALAARQGKVRRIVRLIPVSAVGAGFVRVDPQGNIVKRPKAALRPKNLELPLSAVIPDLFRQAESALEESVRYEITARVRSRMRPTAAESIAAESIAVLVRFLSLPAGVLLRTTLQIGVGRAYSDEIVDMFVDWMGRPFENRSAAVKQARTDAEREAELRRQLRAEVLKEFDTTVLRLEAELSAARLGGW